MAVIYAPSYPFQQTGPPQYIFGGFDLDRLIIPYRGERPLLDSFLAANVTAPWAQSTYDANMFLSGYTVGTERAAPEVHLQWSGKRQGVLGPPKHSNGWAIASAHAIVPFSVESFDITYLAPVHIMSWISRTDESSSLGLSTFGVSGFVAQQSYVITGIVSWAIGSTILGGIGTVYLSQVHVGDQLHIITNTTAPISAANETGFICTVSRVIDNTHIQIGSAVTTAMVPTGGHTWTANQSFGIFLGGISVKVLEIRISGIGGFGTLLTGSTAVDLWGPLIVSSYFHTIVIPTIDSEELIPGQYWRNTRRDQTSLIPAFV